MLVNPHLDPQAVTSPTTAAAGFHEALPGYALTPVRQLGGVLVKDESERLGLPAFKILGASWAVERALAEAPATTMLVAASAGNHGRAVAREAARRGLACRVFLPERSLAVRREAIAAEGARGRGGPAAPTSSAWSWLATKPSAPTRSRLPTWATRVPPTM